MPRSVDEILQHADDLARRFEDYDPRDADEATSPVVAMLCRAIQERSDAERHLVEAVQAAREAGLSWSAIGGLVGTTGEAARQRYKDWVA